jgi:hypothetical protein
MLVWFVSLSAEYPPVATIVATGVQQVDIDFNPFTENRFNSCPFTRDQPQGSSAAARLRQPLLDCSLISCLARQLCSLCGVAPCADAAAAHTTFSALSLNPLYRPFPFGRARFLHLLPM